MAKWLKDYLSFGKKVPPQPPTPDYTESEILKAYRLQRDLDFEDPYEDSENRSRGESGTSEPATPVYGSPMKSSSVDVKSPKHRLIKVDSQELGRTKILLSTISLEDQQEPVSFSLYLYKEKCRRWQAFYVAYLLRTRGMTGRLAKERNSPTSLIPFSSLWQFYWSDSISKWL